MAAVGDGAAAECAGRNQPSRLGTVTIQHRPKILIVSGAADRAASLSGRSLLLALIDSLLASADDPETQHVLKNVSLHFIMDADPSAEDVDCTSSADSNGSGAKAQEMIIRFATKEKFALILAVDFKTVGPVGTSNSTLREQQEKKMADDYIRQLNAAGTMSLVSYNCGRAADAYPETNEPTQFASRLAGYFNGTIVLRLGASCCRDSDRVEALLTAHRSALIRLALSTRQGVAGLVTDAFGQPLASPTIKVTPSASAHRHTGNSLVAQANEDGQFWISLPTGEYAVEVQAPDYLPVTKVS